MEIQANIAPAATASRFNLKNFLLDVIAFLRSPFATVLHGVYVRESESEKERKRVFAIFFIVIREKNSS